jgi:hypothetical protein
MIGVLYNELFFYRNILGMKQVFINKNRLITRLFDKKILLIKKIYSVNLTQLVGHCIIYA